VRLPNTQGIAFGGHQSMFNVQLFPRAPRWRVPSNVRTMVAPFSVVRVTDFDSVIKSRKSSYGNSSNDLILISGPRGTRRYHMPKPTVDYSTEVLNIQRCQHSTCLLTPPVSDTLTSGLRHRIPTKFRNVWRSQPKPIT